MVTMVLLPGKTKSAHKLVHVENGQLLLTAALEPCYATTTLIELASRTETAAGLPLQLRKRKIWVANKVAGLSSVGTVKKPAVAMGGSAGMSTCMLFGMLLVLCLLLVSRKGNEYGVEEKGVHLTGVCIADEDRVLLESLNLNLNGTMTFTNTSSASFDFGRIRFSSPAAVVYPESVRDVEATVRAVRASAAGLTLAAKGRGHSVRGQAQALHGVVVEMSSLKGIRVAPDGEPGCRQPFVDAAGGELWIDVLRETLKLGFAPRSWTDYLYLSIGGTLSNAGVGGQTFLFGPEISNVLQLDVVTGTGQSVKCSPSKNPDLFHGVLGGLGQFGIITSARIVIEPAHDKVRWIRAMYTDFAMFTRDQELLISQPPESAFDYIEGFVVLKNADPNNGWNSVPFDGQTIDPSMIPAEGGSILYYIELVKKFNSVAADLDQTVDRMLAPLSFVPTLIFTTDVPYERFLNRLHDVEVNLASQGLWDVPHPWLNLFVPQSSIAAFDSLVFKRMINYDFSGPILIYPLKRDHWDPRSSAVIPDDESIFYLVAFLRIALPSSGPHLSSLIAENDKIMEVCADARLGCKMYLPEHDTIEGWKSHFGDQWEDFDRRKQTYDPDFILAPGQNIFPRVVRAQVTAA